MRTIAPVMIVLVLGVSGGMLSMAGFAGAWGLESGPDVGGAADKVEKTGQSVDPSERVAVGPVVSAEAAIVGLVIDAAQTVTNVVGAVLFLPLTLLDLGFPRWFALPIASLAYIISTVGVLEFVTNREWT